LTVGQSVLLAPIHRGQVTAFDARRGWGTVIDGSGAEYGFHATAIADGSRMILVGVEVTFVVVPGHRGRDEARGLTGAEVAPTT
jgi:cold shock CspA family protein